MSRARCTVKNNEIANYWAGATHAHKTAEAIVRTLELLPKGDPRRELLRANAHALASTVETYRQRDTLDDAKAFRRLMADKRREVAAIRAAVLAEHGGICMAHESADLDPRDTRYYLCDECRARHQAGVLRRAGGFPLATYQRLN